MAKADTAKADTAKTGRQKAEKPAAPKGGTVAGRLHGPVGRLRGLVAGGGRRRDGSNGRLPLKPALLAAGGAILVFGGAAAAAFFALRSPPETVPALRMQMPPAPDRPPVAVGDSYLVVQPFGRSLLDGLPTLPPAPPLPSAPDPALLEKTDTGRLPRIARDGRMPQQVYAGPFDRGDDRARLVLIIAGIGLAPTASRAAIEQLPAPAVLAIDAYAPQPEEWARAARQAGHEVLATLPLQPAPPDDLGPAALAYAGAPAETMHRLAANLGRFTGYVGVLALGGGGFGDAVEMLRPVAAALHGRGLLLADASAPGSGGRLLTRAAPAELDRRAVDVVIDADGTAAAVGRQLDSLLTVARQHFVAVGLGRPTPQTILGIRSFLARLDEARYVVAPISAVTSTGDQP